MSFFYVISQTCFAFFTPLLLYDCFHYTPSYIGMFLTFISVMVLLCQAQMQRRAMQQFLSDSIRQWLLCGRVEVHKWRPRF